MPPLRWIYPVRRLKTYSRKQGSLQQCPYHHECSCSAPLSCSPLHLGSCCRYVVSAFPSSTPSFLLPPSFLSFFLLFLSPFTRTKTYPPFFSSSSTPAPHFLSPPLLSLLSLPSLLFPSPLLSPSSLLFVYIFEGSNEKCFVYGVEDNLPPAFTPVCIQRRARGKKRGEEEGKRNVMREGEAGRVGYQKRYISLLYVILTDLFIYIF